MSSSINHAPKCIFCCARYSKEVETAHRCDKFAANSYWSNGSKGFSKYYLCRSYNKKYKIRYTLFLLRMKKKLRVCHSSHQHSAAYIRIENEIYSLVQWIQKCSLLELVEPEVRYLRITSNKGWSILLCLLVEMEDEIERKLESYSTSTLLTFAETRR